MDQLAALKAFPLHRILDQSQSMTIDEAILTRRTILKFLPELVGAPQLDDILSAGLWAQNHRLTQPWRFIVAGPLTHQKLCHLYAQLKIGSLPPSTSESARKEAFEVALQKLSAKPTIVVVLSLLQGDSQQRKEDFAATACAIQNIQLSAWARGIGMQWSTSEFTRNPLTYEILGCDPQKAEILGFLFFGYPAEIPPARDRKPISEVRRQLP
jgi:nitroreductase